jgi:hypothetical protein
MELAFNLTWLGLAMFLVWLWLRFVPAVAGDRRAQIVALILVIVILLPAISVTDDLLASQMPAEVDTCLRRDNDWLTVHAVSPVAIALTLPVFAELFAEKRQLRAPSELPAPAYFPPALSSIDNRPPPTA